MRRMFSLTRSGQMARQGEGMEAMFEISNQEVMRRHKKLQITKYKAQYDNGWPAPGSVVHLGGAEGARGAEPMRRQDGQRSRRAPSKIFNAEAFHYNTAGPPHSHLVICDLYFVVWPSAML